MSLRKKEVRPVFNEKLKELRIKKGLTQEELAKEIHVSRSAICKWEMGNGIPSEPNIEGLCDFFNVSEEYLLDRIDLKNYIYKTDNLRKKVIIISFCGMIIPIFLIIFSFVGIFKQLYTNPNATSHILLYIPLKSIFYFLDAGIILPIILYSATITISFINIIQLVKEEGLLKKLVISNISLIFVSIIFYISSFIIATILASERGYGITF